MNTQRTFDIDLPIVLGFVGGYCTGKTTTANGIAPTARMQFGGENSDRILWDHLYFALPLYRMANARQSIEGDHAYDRVLYEIHATLLEVFANNPLYGAPKYDDLIQMVYEIAEYPCPKEGKPRSFLQYVGTEIVRAYDDDAWVKWMDRKIKEEHRKFQWEHREIYCETCESTDLDYMAPTYGVVVSDCRFQNEARLIAEHPNGILINFIVDPEVAAERQYQRDGYRMNGDQKSHQSEQQFNSIPEEWYTKTIDTTNMKPADQIQAVKNLVTDLTGLPT
jgi:hypothetical protein